LKAEIVRRGPQVPARWSYTASVKRMKATVWKWKRLSVSMLHELWTAHEVLTRQGERTDLVSNATKSWDTYCGEIGLNRTTAWRWLKSYDPQARKLIDAEPEHEKPDPVHVHGKEQEKPAGGKVSTADIVANETKLPPVSNGDKVLAELRPTIHKMNLWARVRLAAEILRG
jgi:hypothetical protein